MRKDNPKHVAARQRIAAHLDAHGATPGDVLTEAMGMTPEHFWEQITSPWFHITGKGWDLTEQGRAEAFAQAKGPHQ